MSGSGIPWIEGVELSSTYFDQDHHVLLEKCKALVSAMASQDRALVLDATDALAKVARRHFENEEQRMQASRYHALAKHRASHRMLLESLVDFHKKIDQAEDLSLLSAESAFLEQWLTPHLATDDRQFSEVLSAQEYLRRAPPT